MRSTSKVWKIMYYFGIFVLWVTKVIECNSVSTDDSLTCINKCRDQCYDPTDQMCVDGQICRNNERVCEVKYNIDTDQTIEPPLLKCYNWAYEVCLNHTLCDAYRVCNGQCIRYKNQVCTYDKKTLCNLTSSFNSYRTNGVQACNGLCFNTHTRPYQHCVNGTLQYISNCSGELYNENNQFCINGTICSFGETVCENQGNKSCYNPQHSKCLNGTICQNNRVCGEQCIKNDYQLCASDKRTICTVNMSYNSYQADYMHSCNGDCFDARLQKCVNGNITCINEACGTQCYDPISEVCKSNITCPIGQDVCEEIDNVHSSEERKQLTLKCFDPILEVCRNNKICPIGQDVCEVKYDINYGQSITPRRQCYSPTSQSCSNHIVCNANRVCNGQCMFNYRSSYYVICANDGKTLCFMLWDHTYYRPNQLQACNGTCFDSEIWPFEHCINGIRQYTWSCGGSYYNPDYQVCINDSTCNIGELPCGKSKCYNPYSHKCLNETACPNTRMCGEQCITNGYQVCANDNQTVCDVSHWYENYQTNQIRLCRGECYDSAIQKCADETYVVQNTSSSTTTFHTNRATATDITSFTSTTILNISTSDMTVYSDITSSDSTSSETSLSTSEISINRTTTDSSVTASINTVFDDSTFISSGSASTIATDSALSTSDDTSSETSLSTSDAPISTTTTDFSVTASDNTIFDDSTFISDGSTSTMTDFSITSSDGTLSETSLSTSDILTTTITTSSVVSNSDSISSDTLMTTLDVSSNGIITKSSMASRNSAIMSTNSHSAVSSSSTSISLTTEADSSTYTIGIETLSNTLSHSTKGSITGTKNPYQTTQQFTTTAIPTDTCRQAQECKKKNGCCSPRIEYQCYQQNVTLDDRQACQAIVFENQNNSFVIAIALSDKKVIILNKSQLLPLLLSVVIAFVSLLLITAIIFIVIHRKRIAITLRLWYLLVKQYSNKAEREQWMQH